MAENVVAVLTPAAGQVFQGPLTADGAATAAQLPLISQLSSVFTIASGALPNLGAWASGTAKQNPVGRQVTVNVEAVCDGTLNAATCAVAISPDNVTYTTIGTPGLSVALNTVGGATFLCPVTLPAGWWIKLTFSHVTVAASVYY